MTFASSAAAPRVRLARPLPSAAGERSSVLDKMITSADLLPPASAKLKLSRWRKSPEPEAFAYEGSGLGACDEAASVMESTLE